MSLIKLKLKTVGSCECYELCVSHYVGSCSVFVEDTDGERELGREEAGTGGSVV